MSTVAFSLTSCFDPRMLQNKTLLSFEHVTNWSPPFENATWRTWPHHGLHVLVFAQNKITSSVWPWRTVASTLGVSSTSRLYSSSQLTASSRRLRKIFNNPQNENENLDEGNFRAKSRQRSRFQRGPSLDAANQCEQTWPQASACEKRMFVLDVIVMCYCCFVMVVLLLLSFYCGFVIVFLLLSLLLLFFFTEPVQQWVD